MTEPNQDYGQTNTPNDGVQLEIGLPNVTIERIAERAAKLVLERQAEADGPTWLDAKGAAEYLAAPVSRIHDLVQLRKLTPRRDGRRLLFRRRDLDAYLEESA
jgi:excisionase family DNA binding protein